MSFFEKAYLHSKMSPGLVSLYSMRLIQNIGVELYGLFFPIYLFKSFDFNIYYVLFFYIASFGVYAFLIIPGAKIMSRVGIKRSIIIGIIIYIMYFICLYNLDKSVFLMAIITLIVLNSFRMFYWLPYHVDMAEFTNKKDRAKQISFLRSITTLFSIFIPLISGYILEVYSFQVLFLIVIGVVVVSLIPASFLPKTKEVFEWTVGQTIKNLLSKKNRRLFWAYLASGAESMVGIVIWPIFIWQLLDQRYVAVGFISALVILVTVIVRLVVGNLSDKYSKKKVMVWGTALYSVGWFFKVFVQTGYHIFLASTFHNFSSIVMRTPLDSLTYERAADQGHYVDEYTVLKEISLSLGRTLVCVALIFLVASFGLTAAFILAAVASIFVNIF